MNFYNADTIVAIATPPGEGGVGVVKFLAQMFGKSPTKFSSLLEVVKNRRTANTELLFTEKCSIPKNRSSTTGFA